MVAARKDDSPTGFYTYDRASKQATFLFHDRPDLQQYELASMEGLVIKARDGLDLPAYLSLPPHQVGPCEHSYTTFEHTHTHGLPELAHCCCTVSVSRFSTVSWQVLMVGFGSRVVSKDQACFAAAGIRGGFGSLCPFPHGIH